jgi:hypothetical protein
MVHLKLHTPCGCVFVAPLAELGIPRSNPDAHGAVVWNGVTVITRETIPELLRMFSRHTRLIAVEDCPLPVNDDPTEPREHPDAAVLESADAVMYAYGVQISNAVWWKLNRDAGRPDPTVAMFYHRETNKPCIREDLRHTDRAAIVKAIRLWGDDQLNGAVQSHTEELRLLSGGWPVHCGS